MINQALNGNLNQLNPDGILRIGGRINQANAYS